MTLVKRNVIIDWLSLFGRAASLGVRVPSSEGRDGERMTTQKSLATTSKSLESVLEKLLVLGVLLVLEELDPERHIPVGCWAECLCHSAGVQE